MAISSQCRAIDSSCSFRILQVAHKSMKFNYSLFATFKMINECNFLIPPFLTLTENCIPLAHRGK